MNAGGPAPMRRTQRQASQVKPKEAYGAHPPALAMGTGRAHATSAVHYWAVEGIKSKYVRADSNSAELRQPTQAS
jgi:hypothetical protein